LTRFAGVLAPHSNWRREIVPRSRKKRDFYKATRDTSKPDAAATTPGRDREKSDRDTLQQPASREREAALATISMALPSPGDVTTLAPHIVSVKHWDRCSAACSTPRNRVWTGRLC
jgi:hypothetical protein